MDIHYQLEEDGHYSLEVIMFDLEGRETDRVLVGELRKSDDGWVFIPDRDNTVSFNEAAAKELALSLKMLNHNARSDH